MKKLALFHVLFLIITHLNAQVPTTSLVGYWSLDGTGSDFSGNGNHGTVSGATPTSDRFGNANGAYSFDGINDNIIVPYSSILDMTNANDFSVCFWVKTYSSPNSDGSMISNNTYGAQSGYGFFSNGTNAGYCTSAGQLSFYTASGGGGDACANNGIAGGSYLNTWIFIAGVYDATLNQAKLYVNGVLQNDIGSRGGTSMSSSANMAFGSHPLGLSYFKGALDDIRIYKIQLTQSQVTAVMNECSTAPLPPANITSTVNSMICSGATTTLNVSGISTISWFASPTSTTVLGTGPGFTTSALSAGVYTFYAEDAYCSNVFTPSRTAVTVTTNITPTVSVSGGAICFGESFTIQPASANASTYIVQGGSSGGMTVVSPSFTESYSVTGISSGGCYDTKTITVFVNPVPVIQVNNGTICSGNSFTINPTGVSNFTVSGGNTVVSPITTTSYTVGSTNTFGCSSQTVSTVIVNATPTISTANGVICAGQSYVIPHSGALATTITGNSYTVSPGATTNYTIVGSNLDSCISSATLQVLVNPLPVISISGNNSVCKGSSISLLASGNVISYSWSSGAGSSNLVSVSPAVTTIYTVTGTDANNCSASTTQTVTVNNLPQVGATANANPVCFSNPVTLNGTNGHSYSWSNGVVSNIPFTPPGPGLASYFFTGTDINGCQNTGVITITVSPLPQLNISSSDTMICAGANVTITAQGTDSYSWTGFAAGPQIVVNPTVTSTYTIVATDQNGCSNNGVYYQLVTTCNGLSSYSKDNTRLMIFPNPTNGEFIIELSSPEKIVVTNAIGQIVFKQDLVSGKNKMNLSQLPAGMYVIQVEGNNAAGVKLIRN